MKFGQLLEYNKRNIFLKNITENEAGKLVPDPFLDFKKSLYYVKASGLQLSFNIFLIDFNLICDKNKLYKSLDSRSKDIFNFDFF